MNLGGKPLLAWTLEACIGSSKIHEVILSTDSMEYYELARELVDSDKLTLDLREPDEAGDQVKIFDYLKDKRQKIFGERDGTFILALPTAPLRKSNHIDEAIALYENIESPVFSATSYDFPVSFAFHVSDTGEWIPAFDSNPMITGNTRSQDQQATFLRYLEIYLIIYVN